jgi:hypothetical protein
MMAEGSGSTEPPFHLLLEQEEARVAGTALRLLLEDERRVPEFRPHARQVLAALEEPPGEQGILSVPLTPPQMKVTHTAVKLLFDDLQREQAEERDTLRAILEKLPDEHTMRAIRLD